MKKKLVERASGSAKPPLKVVFTSEGPAGAAFPAHDGSAAVVSLRYRHAPPVAFVRATDIVLRWGTTLSNRKRTTATVARLT
ncbi:hypothetical protein EVAR_97275_1 [Eumeta japonica]|uniref:Uncharacterized protein n=1 Tax=Eumeta variegata TaxID=151549 RepID=A0A4C1XF78_EUMVA|nr:hypothetical protein EVAR_97275_1 [Eumeta japonica]